MRYPNFRAQGLCTSSGVVEAGCKVSIGTRLKRAGMHWTLLGKAAGRYRRLTVTFPPCTRKARHGPCFSLTRAINGRTHSRLVNVPQAEVVRRQIEAGHEFRQQVDAYWKICEQWADEEVKGPSAETAEAVKKGGSRRASKPMSGKKSGD